MCLNINENYPRHETTRATLNINIMENSPQKRFLLVGGGTGGHFYPLIAVAEKLNDLRQQGENIALYYAGPDKYNETALNEQGIKYIHIPAGKRRRYFSPLNFLDPFKTFFGIFIALYKLYFIYPDCVFSKGGFTSVPVVIAAWLLRIPIIIHESDSRAGSANKIAARWARYIGIAYDEVAGYFPAEKIALVGIPIRKAFFETPASPLTEIGLPTDKPLIFVTGGSLGSVRINNLILESLDELLPYYTILHQTGSENEETVKKTAVELLEGNPLLESYFVRGSLTGLEMHLALAGASLVISRAGSTTIYEIANQGKPAIIIPIPEKISHDQRTNAYSYARSGAASVLEEENLTDGLLTAEINRIMSDTKLYQGMQASAQAFAKPQAADTIANTLVEIANEHV